VSASRDPSVESLEPWDFAGWGAATRIEDLAPAGKPAFNVDQPHKKTLGAWTATAICGNDITSSCLYVSALCAAQAGALAPLVLLAVSGVLYLFRTVYAEVGSALPLNGGCYTVLLNTTNKRVAATAACLTLLSYVATAVISASEAMHYANHLWGGLNVFWATLGTLGLFTVLSLIGIGESAAVALVIFLFHLLTLSVLSVGALVRVVDDPSLLFANWRLPPSGGVPRALFFGFAAAMLGISGFESSANFIEEQKPGVFSKTLRNMWIAVAIFNPLTSLLSLGLLPLREIQDVPPDLLARMGAQSMGDWLGYGVSVDAVLVLSGAVLTSFVGVSGLVRRMSLDRCLPQWLLQVNRWRGTNHWIPLGFLLVCATILVITHGKIEALAGVYTLSFLSVMILFAVGNILLKVRRSRLPRETRASWAGLSIALGAVVLGLVGNVLLDPRNVEIFVVYFFCVAGAVAVMFLRLALLRALLFASRSIVEAVQAVNSRVQQVINAQISAISATAMVYFTRGDNVVMLNRAILYVLTNEQTHRLQVVHVYDQENEIPPQLAEDLRRLDRLYPEIRIDFLAVKGRFGPELIDALSRRLDVPKNQMFIGTPGDRFPHPIAELGGVRLIIE